MLDSALGQLPVIGSELSGDIDALSGAGFALVIGILLAFIGARGMASAMQHAANEVWDVPKADRPSGIKEILRSLALLIVGAGGLVATSVLAGFMTGLVDLGSAGRIAGLGAVRGPQRWRLRPQLPDRNRTCDHNPSAAAGRDLRCGRVDRAAVLRDLVW